MQEATLTFQDASPAAGRLVLDVAGGGGTFSFDAAEYEEAGDRLHLSAGPLCAASTELTPEGHLLRVSAPDGRLCGLVLTDVRRRLAAEGRLEVTLDHEMQAVLDAADVAHLLTGHRRSERFAHA